MIAGGVDVSLMEFNPIEGLKRLYELIKTNDNPKGAMFLGFLRIKWIKIKEDCFVRR
ncbi:MAG: hypothetical protein R2799_03235 [Crocinitomicaceae bacterium]